MQKSIPLFEAPYLQYCTGSEATKQPINRRLVASNENASFSFMLEYVDDTQQE